MVRELFETDDSTGLTFLRLSLGIVMFAHGAQKVLGWFGGPGYERTIYAFTHDYQFPQIVALFVIGAEFLGSLALIAGFLTRIAALALTVNIAACALINHVPHGFFMNWFGNQKGEGYEYHILVVGIGLALMIKGGGAFSVDRVLGGRR